MKHGGEPNGWIRTRRRGRQACRRPGRRWERGLQLPELRAHRAAYPRHPLLYEELPEMRHSSAGSELLKKTAPQGAREKEETHGIRTQEHV
jgi:hypothetical protein